MINENNRKWWILLAAGLMIFLVNIDVSIVNLALADIAGSLHASMSNIQWVINSYVLTTVIFFIIGGKLSDVFGRRRIFMIGICFFTLGSLFAGLSQNFEFLILSRVVQGVGFAFCLNLALIMCSSAFPEQQRGLATGIAITLTGLAQALGPTVGGFVLHFASWHWIFLINVPFGITSFILTRLVYPYEAGHGERLDCPGIGLMGLGLFCFVLAINQLSHWGISSWLFLGFLLTGLFILIFFYHYEKNKDSALVNFDLFKNKNYCLTVFTRAIFMFGWSVLLFVLPLYLQNSLQYSAIKTGLILLSMTVIMGILSPITGIYLDKIGFKLPALSSMILSSLAFLSFFIFPDMSNTNLLILTLLLYGIATGIHVPSTVNGALMSSDPNHKGMALGLFFTIAFIGCTLGVATGGNMLNGLSAYYINQVIDQSMHLSGAAQHALLQVANGSQSIDTIKYLKQDLPLDQLNSLIVLSQNSLTFAIRWLMAVCMVLSMIGIITSWKINFSAGDLPVPHAPPPDEK